MLKIAASQPVRSSERARSALEAAGAGWLDASGCPVVLADFIPSSVVMVHPSQLVLLSLSDSTSDSTVTYAGVAFSGT